MSLPRRFFIFAIALSLFGFGVLAIRSAHPSRSFWGGVVWAEDDDNSEEEGEPEPEDGDEDETPAQKSKGAPATPAVSPLRRTVQYQPVTRTVTVTDPGYDTDSDGDELVDALDPDPTRHQKEYFTDSDEDAIADAYDRYPGEDDFAYVEGESDENGNGLIDAYEL